MATRISVLIFAVAVGTFFASGQVRAEDDDAKLMAGKWKVVSAKMNQVDYLKVHKIDKMFAVIEKNTIRVFIEGTKSEQAAEFTVDPKQKPKHIDFTKETLDIEWPGTLPDKLFRGWTMSKDLTAAIPADTKVQGIYNLDGDSLTLCWRTTQVTKTIDVRPSKFQSIVYYYEFLYVLERVKLAK